MKRTTLLFGSMMTVAALLSGCGAGTAQTAPMTMNQQAQPPAHLKPNQQLAADGVDIQETTSSLSVLPSFLDKAAPKVISAYKTAAQYRDLLQWIPCYCGCGQDAGHLNNLQCFIKQVNPDGSVVWDDHGTRCDTCMNIAILSAKMKAQGKSATQIRQVIDSTYDQGFGKPTPTPMPPAGT